MIAKCPCEHCGENIEFATEEFLSGGSVACPHCGKETRLYIPTATPTPKAAAPVPPPPQKSTAKTTLPNQHQLEAIDQLTIGGGTTCPDCGSSQTQRLEMAFAMGVSKNRGTIIGVDMQGEIGVGGLGGTSQTGLSISTKPPEKSQMWDIYLTQIFLGLICFFLFFVCVGCLSDENVDHMMLGFCCLIFSISLALMFLVRKKSVPRKDYDAIIYPQLVQRWLAGWICLRCGKRWIPEQ